MEKNTKPETIDAYIAQYDPELQELLQSVREVIKAAAPEVEERMSWSMPTFYLHENLVHFAVHKMHIGFYPGAEAVEYFEPVFRERTYKYSKGAVQFPLSQPMPLELVDEIVRFRVKAVGEDRIRR